MDIKEIKRRLCEAVDNNAEKIIALGESIFAEPEMGFKEVKTAAKVKKVSPIRTAWRLPASSRL